MAGDGGVVERVGAEAAVELLGDVAGGAEDEVVGRACRRAAIRSFVNALVAPGMLPLFAPVMFQVCATLVPISVSFPGPPSKIVGMPVWPSVKSIVAAAELDVDVQKLAVGTNPVSPSIVNVIGLVASMEPVSAAPVPMNVVLFATVVVVAQMNGWKPMQAADVGSAGQPRIEGDGSVHLGGDIRGDVAAPVVQRRADVRRRSGCSFRSRCCC